MGGTWSSLAFLAFPSSSFSAFSCSLTLSLSRFSCSFCKRFSFFSFVSFFAFLPLDFFLLFFFSYQNFVITRALTTPKSDLIYQLPHVGETENLVIVLLGWDCSHTNSLLRFIQIDETCWMDTSNWNAVYIHALPDIQVKYVIGTNCFLQ